MQESGDQTERDEVSNDQAQSLGARLKSAREAKALVLEKIAEELRIEAHVLRALEEDRLDAIPVAPVFVKGYIQQYGRQLGLDYAELRAAYLAQVEREDVDLLPSRAIRLRDERQITSWIIAALVLLLVGVFLLVWWLGEDDRGSARTVQPVSRPGTQTVAPVPLPAPIEPAPAAPEAADTAPGETPAPNAESAGEASAQPGQSLPLTVRSANSVVSAAPPEVGAVRITLRFREQSWAELTAGDGRRLYYDLGAAGSEATVMARLPVSVLLGNAGGVDIAVGDMPFAIPRQGRRGNIANFVITPASE